MQQVKIQPYPKKLTIGELIEKLKEFPQDEYVWIEGCDCYGYASGVMTLSDNEVLITRLP